MTTGYDISTLAWRMQMLSDVLVDYYKLYRDRYIMTGDTEDLFKMTEYVRI